MLDSKLKAPVFTVRTQGREYGEFVLEPLERGFGVTLGNPLRRILLSSIPGTAVTSVYIEDVLHEFSTIPGVKEDVVEIILNLKELVVRFLNPSLQTVTLLLKAEGPKEVKARDFLPVADVEIMNPDLHIATLEEGGRLNMEVRVDRGVGYVPAEKHGIKDRINAIPVDAVFSPVRRVAFQVEDTRLGQRTDLDKLTLRIWTDGSVTPRGPEPGGGDPPGAPHLLLQPPGGRRGGPRGGQGARGAARAGGGAGPALGGARPLHPGAPQPQGGGH